MSDEAMELVLDRLAGLEWGLAALVNNMHERGLVTAVDVADCFRQLAATQERAGVATTLAGVANKLDQLESTLRPPLPVVKSKG